MSTIIEDLKKLASINLFEQCRKDEAFVGRPFHLDFDHLLMLTNDKWKHNVGGIPAGAFLLALYIGEPSVEEAVLLRVLRPTKLPTDDDVVMAMVDHYKETPSQDSVAGLDSYTRAEFQFSGLECRVIGSFYSSNDQKVHFAGDLDNFYSPHNYRVIKPSGKVLEYIVNFRQDGIPGGKGDERIGQVRYSSSLRHIKGEGVPVYVSSLDFLGKRTALFGMTRTGKSNSVKKIIQATVGLSNSNADQNIEPVGQIIFDINGEYANANRQDAGTAIFEQYQQDVTRYSVIEKPGFKVMKLNFYESVLEGYEMLTSFLEGDTTIYTKAFCNIDWSVPDSQDFRAQAYYGRKVAAYLACLKSAGFIDKDKKVKFATNKDILGCDIVGLRGIETDKGISLNQTIAWFSAAWSNYDKAGSPFSEYNKKTGKEWADEDLKTLMRFLTRKSKPGASAQEAGFRKLISFRDYHTPNLDKSFEEEIIDLLRNGKIVIMDLSEGDPQLQQTFSERVCKKIFSDAMKRFIDNDLSNFIQMYFEEAHNLFPRREEKDLTMIYNRLAKEGQKLRIGLCYATQEVSSISSSILKNTQNWFVSHLNNQEELRELNKYYDFEDFTNSLRRTTDRGFIRLKTDSNTFIVPIQVDQFRIPQS